MTTRASSLMWCQSWSHPSASLPFELSLTNIARSGGVVICRHFTSAYSRHQRDFSRRRCSRPFWARGHPDASAPRGDCAKETNPKCCPRGRSVRDAQRHSDGFSTNNLRHPYGCKINSVVGRQLIRFLYCWYPVAIGVSADGHPSNRVAEYARAHRRPLIHLNPASFG